ncbi:MAG: dihydroorotate dehydrogenase [Clostridiales bacterium]|nr:dihydroorotate dehydrogenase [Clostridiales bacterium]
MSRLTTNLLGIQLKNPVIAASGTFGFGKEYEGYFDPSVLGGISGKGLTLHGSKGNSGIRVCETPAGMMNSIGLENPGVAHFVKHECHVMRSTGAAVICNLGGHSIEDYVKATQMINDADIDILELNISCPNVKEGGMAFGMCGKTAAEVVKKVKAVTKFPLMVKLSPNASDISEVARAVEDAGADAISLINTLLGMRIDVRSKKPIFNNVYAGVSGPAVMPIALRMVHSVCKAVKIPVVGLGGISSYTDALEFIMAGATAIQVGTATFANPFAMPQIIEGLEKYCVQNKLENISEIRGIINK